jgi:3-deoxy-D-manno-octulosonic-acid transferase
VFETEIWPNFMRQARRSGVPVVFVNGRISDVSFARYSRVLRFSGGIVAGFWSRVLADGTAYLMQSQTDSDRLVRLGAPPERVSVLGSLKYDWTPSDPGSLVNWMQTELLRAQRGPLLVAGSVIAGEEPAVLGALSAVREKWPGALLVLAPRKPDRFAEAAAIAERAGCQVLKRSTMTLNGAGPGAANETLAAGSGGPSVFLLDSIGELAGVYQLADVVFIGGSLERGGGHNPLEPATFGKVPIFGPSMENFRDIAANLTAANAAIQVRSTLELGQAWLRLLADSERRSQMGRAAREMVERNRGATQATLDRLARLLEKEKASR